MSKSNDLNILIGEKLSSVIFVMDYLQIDFDGNRFTFNVWPKIMVQGTLTEFGSFEYRNILCSLIGSKISQVELIEYVHLRLTFTNKDTITVSLDPTNQEIICPEIINFSDTKNNLYVW